MRQGRAAVVSAKNRPGVVPNTAPNAAMNADALW
jgi:hypothetical protein